VWRGRQLREIVHCALAGGMRCVVVACCWHEMPRLSVMQAVTPSLVCLDTHTSDSTPAGYTKGLLWWRCRVLLRSRWRWRVLATAAVIGTVNSQ
jgi:hypothetical protein